MISRLRTKLGINVYEVSYLIYFVTTKINDVTYFYFPFLLSGRIKLSYCRHLGVMCLVVTVPQKLNISHISVVDRFCSYIPFRIFSHWSLFNIGPNMLSIFFVFIYFSQTVAKSDPDQALHSLPEGLEVKTSSIPGAGLGVYTLNDIQPRVMYGPYGGMKTLDQEKAHKSGYAWQVMWH